MLLHFFDVDTYEKVINNMQKHTEKNGINYITMYSSNNAPGRRSFTPSDNYLTNKYSNWEVLRDETRYPQWFKMWDSYRLSNNRIIIAKNSAKI